MATLFKPETTKTDPKTGKKVKAKTKKWYGRYRDENGTERRIPLSENKTTAQQMLAEKVKYVERVKSGLIHTAEHEMKKPIAGHIDGFVKSLKSRNNTPRYINDTEAKILRCVEFCRWKSPSQIRANDVEQFLVSLREEHGCSIETGNHYLRAIKSFCRWLYLNKRLLENPVQSLKLLNNRIDRRHDRRALTPEEFQLLINTAETGPPIEGILGIDRAILYLIASFTGLRKGELGSLTKESFNFDNEKCATVTVDACYSKHRRQDIIPLHSSIVQKLKDWLAMKNPQVNELLFPISHRCGGVERKTSKMVCFDLTAAKTFWAAESETPDEEKQRLESDFLQYLNKKGLFADFHCLRHTFITNLGRAKVSPKTAQSLARHSDISLTMNIYTHIDQQEQIDAINSLPDW